MVEKKHVCQADGRSFKSAAALAQHRLDAHGSGRSGSTIQRTKPMRQQRVVGGAPLATTESVRGQQSDVARMSGVDRVFHGPVTSSMPSASVVCDLLITPGLFRRLSVVSRAYQKIRYLRLRFRVEPQVSTTTSGGYVVAFVRDPADDVRDINNLTSQQGSMTTKWWQSSSVTASVSGRDFYTSDSVEVREYSPGRLVVMVDGPATQAGSVTIFAEWSVTLSMATLETTTSLARDLTTLKDVWSQDGHVGLFGRNDDGSFDQGRVEDILGPDTRVGDYFKVEYPAIFPTETKGVYNSLTWLYAKTADDLIPCWGLRSEETWDKLTQNLRVLPKGSVVKKWVPPVAVAGEDQPPLSYAWPTTTAGSDVLQELCSLLCARMGSSSKTSEDSSKDYHESVAP